jgi:hypothetical protein
MMAVLSVSAFVCAGGNAKEPKYKGPKVLGHYRIDSSVSVQSMFGRLGLPEKINGKSFCYQSEDSKAYLWFQLMAHDSKHVGGVLLSSFANCHGQSVVTTAESLPTWKTEKGIGLNSTEQEVVTAYGKPSEIKKVEGNAFRWVIKGDYIKGDQYTNRKIRERGDKVLVYSTSEDLYTAEFGLLGGHVVWIFLSDSE